jgi:microcystin-dependent protein
MTDNYLGEIRAFSFGFTPDGWHTCDGSVIPIQQNVALFALLGIAFGGDGKYTFGLPDLRGRTMIDSGQSKAGTIYNRGETGGKETVGLTLTQMPPHIHAMHVENAVGNAPISTNILAIPKATQGGIQINTYNLDATQNTTLNPNTVGAAGGGGSHNNMQPFLAMNLCIATRGLFPPRPDGQ